MKFQPEKTIEFSTRMAKKLGLSSPIVELRITGCTVAALYERDGIDMDISWEPAEPEHQALGVKSARRNPRAFIVNLLEIAQKRDAETDTARAA